MTRREKGNWRYYARGTARNHQTNFPCWQRSLTMRQNETGGERPLPASDELSDEAAGKFLVETYLFSKLVLFNVWCACFVRLYADNYRAHGRLWLPRDLRISKFLTHKIVCFYAWWQTYKEITSLQRKVILVSLKDAICLRVSRRAAANLSFLPRRERPLNHSVHRQPDVTPQITFSSKRKVPNRKKTNSSIKPNKFHSKYVCFAGQKTRKERKICLKIHLFGFPQTLVMGSTTTAAHRVDSSSTMIGPFKIWARTQIQQPLTLALKFKLVLWVVSHLTKTLLVVKEMRGHAW